MGNGCDWKLELVKDLGALKSVLGIKVQNHYSKILNLLRSWLWAILIYLDAFLVSLSISLCMESGSSIT